MSINSMSTNNTVKTNIRSSINTMLSSDNIKNASSYINNKFINYKKFIILLVLTIIVLIISRVVYKNNYFDYITDHKELQALFFLLISIFFIGSLYATYSLSYLDEKKRKGFIPPGYDPSAKIELEPYIKIIGLFLFGIVTILLVMYGLAKGTEKYPDIMATITWSLFLIIIGIGIYGVYLMFLKYRKNLKFSSPDPGGIRLLQNLSLYSILCLPYDIYNLIVSEYKKAPKEVWNILLIEIVLIAIYFILPHLRRIILYIVCHDAKYLLNKPEYLDREKEVGSTNDIYGSELEDSNYIYNYSISFWYYVNPVSNDDNYYNILTYNGKPLVEYNQHKNKLRIKTIEGRSKETIIYLDNNVEIQKWNHMVINYQSNTMDIFINNELVTTNFKLIMPYMGYDNIMIGQDNGIQGGICNVMYFKRSIPKRDISLIYYLCKYENPPII